MARAGEAADWAIASTAIPESCKPLAPAELRRTEDEIAIVETVELRCEPPDMLGTVIEVDGFADSSINVVLRLVREDGTVHHSILDAGTPSLTIARPEDESHSFFEYLALGVEHLLTGWDHLTFVLGLMLLFGWHRRLIAAVTAFTLGHSLTLALSVLGIVSLPMALVEASIAMTIVVLALELQSGAARSRLEASLDASGRPRSSSRPWFRFGALRCGASSR